MDEVSTAESDDKMSNEVTEALVHGVYRSGLAMGLEEARTLVVASFRYHDLVAHRLGEVSIGLRSLSRCAEIDVLMLELCYDSCGHGRYGQVDSF